MTPSCASFYSAHGAGGYTKFLADNSIDARVAAYRQNLLFRHLRIPVFLAHLCATFGSGIAVVIKSRSEEQMLWVYARRVITTMADHVIGFYFSAKKSVGNTVGTFKFSVYPNQTIPVIVAVALPLPAPGVCFFDLLKKSILWSSQFFRADKIGERSRRVGFVVMTAAKKPRDSFLVAFDTFAHVLNYRHPRITGQCLSHSGGTFAV